MRLFKLGRELFVEHGEIERVDRALDQQALAIAELKRVVERLDRDSRVFVLRQRMELRRKGAECSR